MRPLHDTITSKVTDISLTFIKKEGITYYSQAIIL